MADLVTIKLSIVEQCHLIFKHVFFSAQIKIKVRNGLVRCESKVRNCVHIEPVLCDGALWHLLNPFYAIGYLINPIDNVIIGRVGHKAIKNGCSER